MRALARLVAAAAQGPSAPSSSSVASRAVCTRAGRHLAAAREWRTAAIVGCDAPWPDGLFSRARVPESRAFGTSAPFAVSASSEGGADDGAGAKRGSTPETTRPTGETYEAHLAETVRNVKLLSLASLAATVCGTPLLLELASPDMLPEAKMTISLVVDGFGTFTTALLQWFVSPYVLTMRVEKGKKGKENAKEPRGGASGVGDVVVVEKLTLFARRFEDRFPASAMREAETTRPLVTWEANGTFHYVEMANVPRHMYDRLDLERFDDQARALKHAEETKRDEDDEDD